MLVRFRTETTKRLPSGGPRFTTLEAVHESEWREGRKDRSGYDRPGGYLTRMAGSFHAAMTLTIGGLAAFSFTLKVP